MLRVIVSRSVLSLGQNNFASAVVNQMSRNIVVHVTQKMEQEIDVTPVGGLKIRFI